jgi:hypothetical protein
MTLTTPRPLGITFLAIVVILVGLAQVLTAVSLLGWITLVGAPTTGDPELTGWTALAAGIFDVTVGIGLSTLKRWAWILALVAMGLAVGAAAWALIRHGLDGAVWLSTLSGVVAFVLLAYLLQRDVRNAFEA